MAVSLPQPGLYRAGGQGADDFVYEVKPDGILAYPTRQGIGPGQGWNPYTGDKNALPELPNYGDLIPQYKPVATHYSGGISPTVQQATQTFTQSAGRAPYINPAEQTPEQPKILPNISGQTFAQSQGQNKAFTGAIGSADLTNQLTGSNFQNQHNQTGPLVMPPMGGAPSLGGSGGSSSSAGGMNSMAGTLTPSTPSLPSNADGLFQQLMKNMQPTSEENVLRDEQVTLASQLRNLNQGQGVMNANLEDQPIALPFITGQQAAVEKRYALQRSDVQNQQMTIQDTLANELARRQSAVDISKASLEYQSGKDKAAADQQRFAQEFAADQARFDAELAFKRTDQQQDASKLAADQAFAEKKFNEDVRQYGMDYALKQKQIAIDQQNANTAAAKAVADTPNQQAAIEKKQETLTLAQELLKSDATGKSSAVGASGAKLIPFGQALGWQGNRAAFEAKVDTLKANLTLDNLKLLKGAMSDKDLAFLQAVGSSLNTNMTEAAFDAELNKIIGKLGGTALTLGGTYSQPWVQQLADKKAEQLRQQYNY